MATKSKIIYDWMYKNYHKDTFKTIRSVWYKAKPYLQQYGIDDKSATRYIGKFLWEHFVGGNFEVYGDIGNSQRVKTGELPILLFCEKNTLNPFEFVKDKIYSNCYMSSGQANSYEIANLILGIMNSVELGSDLFVYTVTDFDKAGDLIEKSLVEKLSLFFNVIHKSLEVNIYDYETFVQPNGDIGLEIDAIDNLEHLVLSDLEEFLPYELFEEKSIEEAKEKTFSILLESDTRYNKIVELMNERIDFVRNVAENDFVYDYCNKSSITELMFRVDIQPKEFIKNKEI